MLFDWGPLTAQGIHLDTPWVNPRPRINLNIHVDMLFNSQFSVTLEDRGLPEYVQEAY